MLSARKLVIIISMMISYVMTQSFTMSSCGSLPRNQTPSSVNNCTSDTNVTLSSVCSYLQMSVVNSPINFISCMPLPTASCDEINKSGTVNGQKVQTLLGGLLNGLTINALKCSYGSSSFLELSPFLMMIIALLI
jgi:hypothetical protein